ncbi:MAG: TetR/AcrR family transcriptional regulator [Pseudomonadota bacterium]|nr:TetR/AcrR family transcriptional regulator [Pseudomonadota bacterium]
MDPESSNFELAQWPVNTTIEAFKAKWHLEGEPLWNSVFEMHKNKMQVKNAKVAIPNLEKILMATFRLANSKGFEAMSLRDLKRETGISIGGLYAYIGSKNDLASVIMGVLLKYMDKVIGGLANDDLAPVNYLRAMVFGEIYMMEILNPWYYFCFMELKGLPREQQQKAMDAELRFESIAINIINNGIEEGQFSCEKPELLASQVAAQLQQWHLKHWKFKLREVTTEEYGKFVFDSLLLHLGFDDLFKNTPGPDTRQFAG